ncbi:MAG: mycobactin polyketide synthase MbtD [Mycobacterium sp.]
MPKQPLPDRRIPVLLSAHEQDLVSQDAGAILNYLDRKPSVTAVAATLLATRGVRRHRAVLRAADRTELAAGLRALADDDEHPLAARSSGTAAPRIAFVFPGQGNQWRSMGADAYQRLAAYRAEVDRCAQTFAAAGLESPLAFLLNDADQDWPQIQIQGAQFTHAVGLARVWQSCGILPDVTLGHSLGEVAAGYVAGAVALPDAIAVVAARATVVDQLPGGCGMAVLGTGIKEAERLIAETQGWLEVSAVNSDTSSVVSGDRDAVADIVQLAERQGMFAKAIAVDYPGHTSALEPLRDTMRDTLNGLLSGSAFLDAPVEFIGSARGGVVDSDTDFTDYWCDNLCNTVRFDHAVAEAVLRGAGAFIEMSAHPSLLGALTDLTHDALIVGSGRRDECIVDQLSGNIAAVAVAEPGYRWSDVADVGGQVPLPGFPNAPMKAVHLWARPEPLPRVPGSDLTVACEEWQPRPEAQPVAAEQSPRRVAIVGPDPMARELAEAVAAHQGCEPAAPEEAEIAVLIAPALQHPDVPAAADEIASAAGRLDYQRAVGPRCRRVWLVTAGGERVSEKEPVALPGQAALAAMHRCVGFEFPERTFAHLDLPSRDIDGDTAQACIDVFVGGDIEVALRDTGRYARTLRECGEPARERPLDAAALETVLITGGSGGIGLRYARHCVEQGARRVILLSRKGLDQARLDKLVKGYQAAEVHAPACDITDPEALSAVAADYGGDGASLLIHAAGAARFAPHDQLSDADWADVLGAKVTGLAHIAGIWPLRHDVRVLLCSSVSGVWGGHGHAAYAASNRFLYIFGDQLRAKGLDCTTVRWGLWPDTGIADADEISRIERSGLVAMNPDAAISASLRHHDSDPLILAADLDRLRLFFETQGSPMPFRREAGSAPEPTPGDDSDGSPEKSVTDIVRAELATALSVGDPASVDLSAALVDVGVDSLLALDLRKRLRRRTGGSVPLARMLGGITGAELIDALQSDPDAPATTTPDRPQRSERVESSRD